MLKGLQHVIQMGLLQSMRLEQSTLSSFQMRETKEVNNGWPRSAGSLLQCLCTEGVLLLASAATILDCRLAPSVLGHLEAVQSLSLPPVQRVPRLIRADLN